MSSSWETVKTSQVEFGQKYADAMQAVTENYQRMCYTHIYYHIFSTTGHIRIL
jgi:hypothetical protein